MSGPSRTLKSGIGLPKAHEAYRRKEIAMEAVTFSSLLPPFQKISSADYCRLSRYFFLSSKISEQGYRLPWWLCR
jgi:hypothetical protein